MISDAVIIQGHKLFPQANGLYRNEFGKSFAYDGRSGRLYEERSPGKWFWLRGRTESPARTQPESKPKVLRF